MDEELKRIVEDYLSLQESDENARRRSLWKTELTASLVASVGQSPRRVPKPRAEVGVPIIADTSVSIWREVFNYSAEDYYTNPRTWLVNYLKASIAHFKLGDDTYLSRSIGFFPGSGWSRRSSACQAYTTPWRSQRSVGIACCSVGKT